MIRSLADSGISIIISSYILSEIQQVADDIGMIYDGRLIYEGSIDTSEDLERLFMDIIRKERKD